jgi:UDP-3-O-[3-hydroxymyristoyl] N-acetylglucosamine deacetylase
MPLSACAVRSADRGVRIGPREGGFDVESVEHLFAALGAWQVRRDLDIHVTGGEVPLADGGAARFAAAVASLNPPRARSPLRVVQSGKVEIAESIYAFEPGPEPILAVEVHFEARAIGTERASWDGSFERFVSDVAWARTFGFRRDAADLLARGRALGADAHAVMVLDDEGRVEPPDAPARPSEFARHKLLDMIGDLYLFGGPPLGAVSAIRPGHAATHRAVALALERGLLAFGPSAETPGAW